MTICFSPNAAYDCRRWPRWVIALALLLVTAAADTGFAESCNTAVRPQDEILLLNSRPVGCTTDTSRLAAGLEMSRYEPVGASTRQWIPASWEELLSGAEAGAVTVFYVHGNRVTQADAPRRGMMVYRRLIRCAEDDRPIRFITWSWPSSPIKGRLKDFQVKAQRTRPVAFQLAWLVNQMPPNRPMGFIGYSYGARIESGAAHLLAGGSLSGLQVVDPAAAIDRPASHVYLAPAFESGWLAPCRYHGKAMDQIDRLLTTTNPRDPAMRWYPLLSKAITERALGFAGPTGLPRRMANRVQLLSVQGAVGKSHDLQDYLASPGLMRAAWRRLTFADSPAATPMLASPTPSAEPLAAAH